MKPNTVQVAAEAKSLRLKRFWFNAVVGVMMIMAGGFFSLLGFIGIISIIGAGPGFWLLICSVILYACGARLVVGALIDG